MRPAFILYAEYTDGAKPADLACKYGLRPRSVAMMLKAVRQCLALPAPRLLPDEAARFGKRAA